MLEHDAELFIIDDLRADIDQLEDDVLGLEHDITLVAEILRGLGAGVWGNVLDVSEQGLDLTDDQAAVLDRLLLL